MPIIESNGDLMAETCCQALQNISTGAFQNKKTSPMTYIRDESTNLNFVGKLLSSWPWLVRYPAWRTQEVLRRMVEKVDFQNLIFIVANHYEPAWNSENKILQLNTQIARVDDWCRKAREIGNAVRGADGKPFCHTYFYPAEQYLQPILDQLAELQCDGFGEVEVHLHHGTEQPDNGTNLRRMLEEFRDILAEKHQLLSRESGLGRARYAFVHGNLALANSASDKNCGVDSEMQILADTGCYADFTLPSAPDESQVPRINAIYQCGHELHERAPHRSGPNLRVGEQPALPVLFTGPLVFDWRRRIRGFPVPRIDTGSLAGNYPLSLDRLNRWRQARIGVRGRPEWVFIKLYCHGFFPYDQEETIGEPLQRFLEAVLDFGEKSGQFNVYFVTAREAFNIAMAAVDGHKGSPELYRDYKMRSIMKKTPGVQPTTAELII